MIRHAIEDIIRDLNESQHSNPEYLRGQVEMAMCLLGYEDDGYDLRQELTNILPAE